MDPHDELWQRRVQDLYANVGDLYAHVEITIVVFDRELCTDQLETTHAYLPLLRDVARQVLDGEQSVHDVALDATGRRRAHAYPLRNQTGVAGVACVVEDDGARRELFVRCALAIFDGYRQNEADLLERERRAHEEARRANRQRDQFMATISHELRGPLAAILLWEQVLRGGASAPAIRAQALDVIRESATAQALMVADLIDVSRAINGKLHLQLGEVSIERVLVSAMENARPAATMRHLAIESHLEPDLGLVLGDPHRLQQIVANLLSNAIKCTAHGRITIRSRLGVGSIVIDVCDTGRGISPEFLSRVFDPFSQEDDLDGHNGLGLGLAIARQLVELHGGTLAASSEGIGCGATFTMTIPRMPVVVGDGASPPPMPAQDLGGVRILVVDDDPRILAGLRVLLAGAGAIVATAASAMAADAVLIQDEQIDVVLSDLAMPDEDGCSFMRRLRRRPEGRGVPAIAITAHVGEPERRRALDAGFDVCLAKPIDVAALISHIARLVTAREPAARQGL